MLESKDFVSQLAIFLPKASVLFPKLIENFRLLGLHCLEGFELLLNLVVLVFSLLVKICDGRFLLFNDCLKRLDLVREVIVIRSLPLQAVTFEFIVAVITSHDVCRDMLLH